MEQRVADIVAAVLELERVSVLDSFFDIGGTSLSATRVTARVAEACGVDLGVRALFEAPTVRGLAAHVAAQTVGGPGPAPARPLVPQRRPDPLPLSFAQQRMWFINQFDPASPAYNIPLVLIADGPLDAEALRLAFLDVLARHEVLRTCYPADPRGVPHQRIVDDAAQRLDFAVRDTADAAAVIAAEVGRGFDVTVELPIRVRLVREAVGRASLVVVLHHIAADGQSGPVLLRDLADAYRSRSAGRDPRWTALPIQYADYALWQAAALGSPGDEESLGARQTRFWSQTLAGAPEVLDLPADRPRPAVRSGASGSAGFGVDAQVRDRLVELGREHGASLFMVVHAAVATMLARLSATTDITVATPVAGRGRAALDELVGMFVNTVILRSEVDPAMTAADLLAQVRDRDLAAFEHTELPFERVVEVVDPARSDSFEPLAQVLLVFVAEEIGPLTVGDLTLTPVDPGAESAKYDLTVGVLDRGRGGLGGSLVYAADLFDEPTAHRFARALESILVAMADSGGRCLGDIALLDDRQRQEVATAAHGPVVALAPETIPDALDTVLRADPETIGLITDTGAITNGRFAELVAHYARILIDRGVGPEVAVAVCMPRGLAMVVAVHAVLAAGGHYVPVDTALPADRADYMFADAGVRIALIDADHPDPGAMTGRDIARVLVDPDTAVVPESSAPVRDTDRRAPLRAANAAYTIFTSGSTGRPKGVTVSHRSVLNRLRWGLAAFPLGAGDTVILKTPYTFDVSVPELVAPLLAGARMFIARDGGHADPEYLIDVLAGRGITSVHFVPAMLAVFLDVVDEQRLAALRGLRYVFASGEALAPTLARRARDIWPWAGLHDLFGPTEAAVEVSHADLAVVGRTVPIGHPVWNTATHVLDTRLRPVGAGVPGELYLGGVQLARGYAARPGQTADRFVADPGGPPGARLYRTGDLVARNPAGALEYLGRTDFQVKLRGQRIELGEVESVLAAVPGVVHAAATVATAPTGAEHLVAYLAGHGIVVSEAKAIAAQALPEYMVPTVWQLLADVPLNPAGKLDRRALPEPDFTRAATGERVAPQTVDEGRIAEIVAGVLGVDRVGVTDSFFALGGDSIMSIQLSALLRGQGYVLSPRDIFEQRTVRGLAARAATATGGVLAELPGGADGPVDVTPAIAWMLENSPAPNSFADYSQAFVLTLPAALTESDLLACLGAVVERHAMLSATLRPGPAITAGGADPAPPARVTVTPVGAAIGTAEFDCAIVAAHRAALGRLDPGAGAMVAAAGVRSPAGPGRLVLAVHHAVVDGVSWRTIIADLAAAAAARRAGQAIALPPAAGTSMRRWARVLAEQGEQRLDEIPRWREHLPAAPALGSAAPVRVADTVSVVAPIPADVTEAVLGRVTEALRTGADTVLMAAVLIAVARRERDTGGTADSAAMLIEGHGRVESIAPGADLSGTVGWFTSLSPVAVATDLLTAELVRAVKSVKEAVIARPDEGIGFGPLRWGRAADAELAARELPPIVFNYLGAGSVGSAGTEMSGLDIEAVPFVPAPGAPALPGTVRGAMIAPALTVNINTGRDGGRRRFDIELSAGAPLDTAALTGLGASITEILTDLATRVEQDDPGPSPSDIAGGLITQDEIDALLAENRGADLWGLSPLQQGLLFQSELAADEPDGTDPYLMQTVLELRGTLDEDRLRDAAGQLLVRQAVLRSAYRRTGSGRPVAVIAPHVDAAWRTVDLRDLDEPQARAAAREVAHRERATRFDLAHPPLIRFVHALLPGDVSLLIVTNHHLLSDGWSAPLVLAEFFAGYAGAPRSTAADYRDFLGWVAGRDAAAARAAWQNALSGVRGPTLVAPGRKPRPAEISADHRFTLGAGLTERLSRLGRENEVTTAVLLQLAWAVVVGRLTGADTVVFGETVSGRPADLPGSAQMIGLLINTVPVAVTLDDTQTVAAAARALAARKTAVLDHQYLSLPEIAAVVGQTELFDTLAVFESYPVDADGLSAVGAELGVDIVGAESADATHYPLTLVSAPARIDGSADISVTVKYLRSVFADDEAGAIAEAVRAVLAGMAAAGDGLIGELSLSTARSSAGPAPVPGVVPVPLRDLFARAAADHADAVAVIAGRTSMTYRKLDEASNRLARVLLEEGAGPEVLVALAIPRSVELLIAIWAVAKTGAGYVPVDPEYPADRVAGMIADSGARFGLTSAAAGQLPPVGGIVWHRVDRPEFVTRYRAASAAALEPGEAPAVRVDNTAYVIFTSGSTGRPKGVAVTHRGLANFAAQEAQLSDATPQAHVLAYASPSFDASVLEYLLATISGGALVYRPADAVGGAALAEVIADGAVTHAFLTPSVVASLEPHEWDGLRALFVGGEDVGEGLVDRWAGAGRRLQNLYGPTETTIGVTISDPLRPGEPVALGAPLDGVELTVLDGRLRPLPAGFPGELYVHGNALSRGYLDRPGLTAERFVAHPAVPGERMYRTGDVVAWHRGADGRRVLRYRGRNDDQVKLRGLRIELGEIESALTRIDGVASAVVVGVDADGGVAAPGDSAVAALAAYVVLAGRTTEADVRQQLAAALPSHFVPATITAIGELPLTPVGKLDRQALPAPTAAPAGADHRPLATAGQRAVAAVFTDLLGVDRVGANDSFFDLGGNSLSATRLVARLGETLGVAVRLSEVFADPTVAGLAARAAESGTAALPPVTRADPRPERVPLSFAQQRMWFINQFDPAAATYNIAIPLRLTGPLDPAVVRAAVLDVVNRHEVLRTVFPAPDGRPYQQVLTPSAAADRFVWRAGRDAAALDGFARAGFDVTVELPLRAMLHQAGRDEHVLLIVVQHIAADGESMGPLVRDLVAAYRTRAGGGAGGLAPLGLQYADYAVWQRAVLGEVDDPGSLLSSQLDYWTAALAGVPDVLELPTDRPRPAVADHVGAAVEIDFGPKLGRRIRRVARAAGVTEFMVLHAALAVLLARLAGTEEVVVGTPVAGRGQTGLDDLVGMFVNTLAVRSGVDPSIRFSDFLAQIRETDLAAFANAEVPFEAVVEAVDPVRSEAFSPLFQVLLTVNESLDIDSVDIDSVDIDSGGVDSGGGVDVAGLRVSPAEIGVVPAQVDLTVELTATLDGWRGRLVYATALFDEDSAVTLVRRLRRVLKAVTKDPARVVGEIPVLGPAERTALVARSRGPRATLPAATLPRYLAGPDAAGFPGESVAVRCGARALTRRDFGIRVNALARELIAAGVGPDVAVAICLPRSVEMVIAVHAVIAAGGQFVPIDPDAPAQRGSHLIATAGVRVVLVTAGEPVPGAVAQAPDSCPVLPVSATMDLAGLIDRGAPVTDADRRGPVAPEHAAYTLFTSGSTGQPKGVTVDQRAIVNRLVWMAHDYEIGAGDVVLQKTPFTFDVSVWELLLPVAVGAPMVVAEPGRHGDPAYLVATIAEHAVSVIHFVPSMLSAFAAVVGTAAGRESGTAAGRELGSVRRVFTSGEALTPATAAATRTLLPQAQLHNLYGPTEAAIDVTAEAVVDVGAVVPIGRPVANTDCYVLDARLNPVPTGVRGELYLGGVQLARGYARRPDLTAERFVANPLVPGQRLYRTGDLVCWNSAGALDYLGRTDFQVKLRGQRIELGEIEAAMTEVPGVVMAAAAVVDTPGGDRRLVGYYRPASVSAAQLRTHLGDVLPGYMIPTGWVGVDDFALNPAGKLDRSALPAPPTGDRAAPFAPPENEAEHRLATVFAQVLGLDRISVTDSFFDLGGTSLSATRAAARAGDALHTGITIRDVFDHPTVRELAARSGTAPRRSPPAPAVRPPHIPLSPVQRRMWILNQFDTAAPTYNIPIPVRLRGAVDPATLRAALIEVLIRHEVLRTVYPADGDQGPHQEIWDAAAVRRHLDWARSASREQMMAEAGRGFDVSAELPIRARFVRPSGGAGPDGEDALDLLIVVHHIAFDGQSAPLFVRDLVAAYGRLRGDDVPAAAPLPVQYADYTLWQLDGLGDPGDPASRLGRQFAYWRDHLAGLRAVTDLPMDRPRPAVADHAGARLQIPLDAATTAGLAALAAAAGTTVFMVHHALLAVLVARLAATDDVVIGTPVDGRTDAALHDLVGMFVNTLVLRTRVEPGKSVADLLAAIRRTDLDAFSNADADFEQLVDALAPARPAAHAPLFQIALTVADGPPDSALTGAGVTVEPLPIDSAEAKVDLTVSVGNDPISGGGFLEFSYATALFDEATVRRFAQTWQAIAAAAIGDPSIAVGDIELAGPAPRRPAATAANRPAGPPSQTGTLVDILARRDLDPTHPALICGAEEIDYREFESRTNRLARALISRGAGPEDIIAVAIPRSIDFVVAVWGVLKSGAAYLPVDPGYPADRVDYMMADSGTVLGITADGTPAAPRGEWLDLRELGGGADAMPVRDDADEVPVGDGERTGPVRLSTLAYLIYTSGSTGRPKAVAVSNSGIADLVAAHRAVTGTRSDGPDTRVLHVASPGFDASFFEMIWAIAAGHTLVIAPAADYAGPALDTVIADGAVTDLVITPSVLASLDPRPAETVRNLATAGETCPPELVSQWAARGRRLFNFYGPSETTVWATRGRLLPGRPVTIGSPIGGFTAHILDARLHPVPTGVVGELYLAADGLARGYFARPGLTAARFVANPFAEPARPGSRLYATGDLVRVLASGDLEFAGRADHQVKINGQRVELGEIEAVLAAQPGVRQAVVLGVGDEGAMRLVGYLVAEPATGIDTGLVEEAVRRQLPDHMVPTHLIPLAELPLTASGKLDRDALPAPESDGPARFAAPQSDGERVLADIVAGLLGRTEVSVTESFFALGGDSIMSIQLASAAKAAGLALTPREIFEYRTVRAMAAVASAGGSTPPLAEPADGADGEVALPPIVAWLLEQTDGPSDYADFSQAMVLTAPRALDERGLRAVLTAVAAAHPALRATLDQDFASAALRTGSAEPDDAVWTAGRTVPAAVGTGAFAEAIRVAHAQALDHLHPTVGVLVAAVLVRDAAGDGRVVLAIHHLGVDAVSWPILVEDLATAWSQYRRGAPIVVRPEVTSVRGWFAAVTRDADARRAQEGYWLSRLPQLPTPLGPPLPEGDR
ncbi:amino acid adenylation domain-containing protein [Gordonia defluvii]|uniref:amino acid adenylation domain-containing protein n=1 Tax=Gordonia defluvii TaxID=283718 RepID=UPI0031D98748